PLRQHPARASVRRLPLAAWVVAVVSACGVTGCTAPTAPTGGPAPETDTPRRRDARSADADRLTGADGVRLASRVVGDGPDTAVVLHGGVGPSMSDLADDLTPLAAGHM